MAVSAKGQFRRLRCPWCGLYTVVSNLDDITFQIRWSANARTMVVHYDRLKPYLGDRYQPDVDDDNDSNNDSEQEEEKAPLLTLDGGSLG